MKYPAPIPRGLLLAAVASGILIVVSAPSNFAQPKQAKSGPNAEQWFLKPKAVPAGIGASDWAGILAAHQEATNNSRPTNAEPETPDAPTTDPIAQQAYLQASNLTVGGNFGVSVAISGDTVVVGSNGERTGENGQDAPFAGAAYVFVRNGTTWTQQAYLKAPKPKSLDSFGISVAISNDTVVVGAFGEDSDEVPEDEDNSGGAYVLCATGPLGPSKLI